MVHDRWQRVAAWWGALVGLGLASWLLLRSPAATDRVPAPSPPPAVAVGWCALHQGGFARAIDQLAGDPGWPRADVAATRSDGWSALAAGGTGDAAWRGSTSVPSGAERAEAVRQLEVLRDALGEAAASGQLGAARSEARALDRLLGRWC